MRKRTNNSQNQNSGKGRHRRNSGHGRNSGNSHGHQDAGRKRKAVSSAREKYLNMARDAINAGDRVKAENYFQYADHYLRVMNSLNEGQEAGNAKSKGNGGKEATPPAEQKQEAADAAAEAGQDRKDSGDEAASSAAPS